MNIIIFGPPGSGKGTQAKLLAKNLGLTHVSTGDILREVKKEKKELVLVMKSGNLVSDELVMEVLENYLNRINTFENIIFDGSPRSLAQYEAMKRILQKKGRRIDYAINLKVGDEEVVKRLSARRIDNKTGQIYNLVTNPPREVDGKDLIQREDDKPEAIKERLRLQKPPKEMLDAFMKDSIYFEVDGERSIEEIQKNLLGLIKQCGKSR